MPTHPNNRTPPRVPSDVSAMVMASASSSPASPSAVAAAARARAIALSMRQEAVAAQRDPSPDRNSLLWQPTPVRILGLRDPAAAMNGEYHPEPAKGTPANRSLGWRTHNGRPAYFGKLAVLYFDGAASWKLGPELGSSQCCCFGTDSMADKPEQVIPGSWKVWRDGCFQTQEDLLVESLVGCDLTNGDMVPTVDVLPDSEVALDFNQEIQLEPEPALERLELEPEPEPKPQLDVEPEPEPQLEPESVEQEKFEPEAELEPDSELEQELEADAEQPQLQPQKQPELGPEGELEPEPGVPTELVQRNSESEGECEESERELDKGKGKVLQWLVVVTSTSALVVVVARLLLVFLRRRR